MDDKAPRKPHWGVGDGKREGCGEVPPSGDMVSGPHSLGVARKVAAATPAGGLSRRGVGVGVCCMAR